MKKKSKNRSTGRAVDFDNSVNLNGCLFCNSICTDTDYPENEWLSSSSSFTQSSRIPTAEFLVRVLLEIPQSSSGPGQQLNFLDNISSVSTWLKTCDQCTKAVSQAQLIYTEILDATKRFRSVQQEFVQKLKGISDVSSDLRHIPHDDHMIIDKCRQFAKEHLYNEFGYPLIVYDAESLKKSATVDDTLMEFTDAFPIKPEPDDQELQFILPDDGHQAEHLDIQTSNSSEVSSSFGTNGRKEHKCVSCRRVFNNRSTLYSHNQKYHKPNVKRNCEFCGSVLANAITYRRHIKTSCKNKPVEQLNTVVKKKGRSKQIRGGYVTNNLNKGVVRNKVQMIGSTGKKVYKCVSCERVFNNRSTLYSHNQKYHKPDTTRTCEFCGSVLANSIVYRRHIKTSCKNRNFDEKGKGKER